MPVVDVMPLERSADETGAAGSATLSYIVKTDDKNDQAEIVLASSLLPQHGDLLSLWASTHPRAAAFRCGKRTASQIYGPLVFSVECEFNTNPGRESQASFENRGLVDPNSYRTEITKQDRDVDVPFERDALDDKLLLNTAGDPIEGLTTLERQTVYTVRWNTASLSPWMIAEHKYTNKDVVNVRGRKWAPGTLKIDSVDFGDETWDGGVPFFPITATIIGWSRGWKRRIISKGLYELPVSSILSDSPNKKRRCRRGGDPVEVPVPLDKNGAQIPEQELKDNPDTAPHTLLFNEFPQIKFRGTIPNMV